MKNVTYRELSPRLSRADADAYPSLVDSFSPKPIEHKKELVDYLSHGGEVKVAAMAPPRDLFTGDLIPLVEEVRVDSVYQWNSKLSYYVDRYNLQLPQDFVNHILQVS